MARRKKIIPVERPAPTYPFLETYGLELGQKVQFKKPTDGKWIPATVRGDNRDGSIHLSAQGMSRAIMPEFIQVEVVGPRGGRKWVDLIVAPST